MFWVLISLQSFCQSYLTHLRFQHILWWLIMAYHQNWDRLFDWLKFEFSTSNLLIDRAIFVLSAGTDDELVRVAVMIMCLIKSSTKYLIIFVKHYGVKRSVWKYLEAESFHDLLTNQPTLLRLLPKVGLDIKTGMDFLSLGGIIVSFVAMVSHDYRNCVVFSVLWAFYLSLFQVSTIISLRHQISSATNYRIFYTTLGFSFRWCFCILS